MAGFAKLLFVGLALVLLYLAFVGVDWGAFFAALRSISLVWVSLCLVFQLLALLARAYRWSVLLAYRAGASFFVSFIGEAVGDIGNTFLPARAGEAMRTVMVARKLDISLSFVIGTAASERVSDAVFVSLVAFLMILIVSPVPLWLTGAAAVFSLLGILVLAVLSFMPVFNRRVLPLLQKLPIPARLLDKMEGALMGVWHGSEALLGHSRRTALYLVLTILFWLADAISIICLARAFGDALSLPQAALFLSALGLSSAVPSTPGYIGIYQFVAVSVLVPFNISHVHALALVLVYQVVMILLQLTCGGIGWLFLAGNEGRTKKLS